MMKFFFPFLFLIFIHLYGGMDHEPVSRDKIPDAPYLNIKKSMKTFDILDEFVIEPVFSENYLHMPVVFVFDTKGRIWVAEMQGYMKDLESSTENQPISRILILEDKDKNGIFESKKVFLDLINDPRTLTFTEKGLLYSDGEGLYHCEITVDDKPKNTTLVDGEFAIGGNIEHRPNQLIRNIDNWYYTAKSSYRYRYNYKTKKWIKELNHFRGQWGISIDNYGKLIHNHNSYLARIDKYLPDAFNSPVDTNKQKFFKIPSGFKGLGNNKIYPSRINPGVNRGYKKKKLGDGKDILGADGKLIKATAASFPLFYRGDQFPKKYRGWVFVAEPAAHLIKAIDPKKTSYPLGKNEFLTSTDERFRPITLQTGHDGAIYFIDLHSGVIQHKHYLTSYLRRQIKYRSLDQSNDFVGRIYRIRYTGKNNSKWNKKKTAVWESSVERIDLGKLQPTDLVDYFFHKNGWYRDNAQRILVALQDKSIKNKLLKGLKQKTNEIASIHSIYTLEGLGLLDKEMILIAINSSKKNILHSGLLLSRNLNQKELIELESVFHQIKSQDSVTALYLSEILAYLDNVNNRFENFRIVNKLIDQNKQVQNIFAANIKDSKGWVKAMSKLDKKLLQNNEAERIKKMSSLITNYTYQLSKIQNKKQGSKNLSKTQLFSFNRGKKLFQNCSGCHGVNGEGLKSLAPPLNKSEWVLGNPLTLTAILLYGLEGKITVRNKEYNFPIAMPGLLNNSSISDRDLVDIMTYIRKAWDNNAKDKIYKEHIVETKKQYAQYSQKAMNMKILMKNKNLPYKK